MAQPTAEQRVFIVLNYARTQSPADVRNRFRERFPNRNPPVTSTILRNAKKYQNSGTSLNLIKDGISIKCTGNTICWQVTFKDAYASQNGSTYAADAKTFWIGFWLETKPEYLNFGLCTLQILCMKFLSITLTPPWGSVTAKSRIF